MMVKIGNTYFAENAIEAIVPEWIPDRRTGKDVGHDSYDVHLANGNIVTVKSSEKEVAAVVSLFGLLAPPEEAEIELDREELEELATLFGAGFRWAARDRDGKAFAYKDKPTKGRSTWQAYEHQRLRHDFVALTFDAETPLDLTKLFTGVPG